MASILDIADYVVIGLMLAISAGVGIYFRFTGGKQKTTLEFLLADKSMSILPVTFSIVASSFSAVTMLGTPSEVYLYGLQILIRDVFFSVGLAVTAYCILPIYFHFDDISIYEYLGRRFGKTIKLITSVLFSIQMLLYMPCVMYAPSLALSTVTGISVWTSVISVNVVCIFYSTLGGLKAVLWTDFFQTFVMFITVYCLIVKGSLDFGGFYKVFETAQRGSRTELFNTSFDFTIRYTFWNTLAQGLVFGIFWSGTNFLMVQRLLSCGSLKKAQKCLLWSMPFVFLIEGGVCILGVVIYSFYSECDPIENGDIESADQLVPLFILKLFGHVPCLSGLCVAGIFSAALSSMSSVINSLAAVTLEDYVKPYAKCKSFNESKSSFLSKLLAVFYGVICLFLTFGFENAKGLTQSVVILIGMVGGPTLAVFCLGMCTTSSNELGSILGLISGFAFNAWIGFGSLFNKSKYPTLPLSNTGCSSNITMLLDEITKANSTADVNFSNFTSLINSDALEEVRNIFPLYKISFEWHVCLSFIITVIVGYVTSFIIGFWKPGRKIDPQLLSPIVRRWLGKTSVIETEKPLELSQAKGNEDFNGL